MNIKITNDEKNPLFKRREITAKLGYDNKTPSRQDIRKEIAKKLGAKEELVVVKRIKPDFGTPAANLEFNVYDDEKTMKEVEEEYMVKRHAPKGKKGAKAEPAPAPAAPAADPTEKKEGEAPVEEKNEEKPKEEKKEEPPKEDKKD